MSLKPKTIVRLGCILGAASLCLVSCGESEQAITQASTAAAVSGPVTYATVQPIIQNRCGICHIGGGTQPDFGGYAHLNMIRRGEGGGPVDSTHLVIDDVIGTMEDGSMPPGGPRVSQEELARVKAWRDQGMKQ